MNSCNRAGIAAGTGKISRRRFLRSATAAALVGAASCRDAPAVAERSLRRKVIILGYDAVDPVLLRRWMAAGQLPNLSRLARDGAFSELGSSIPPESPVAWSTFSVSAQAGVHGIYDFLGRDTDTYAPRIAAVEPEYPEFLWDLIPLGRPGARCLRGGKPFWVAAAEDGIKTAVLEAPVAFPATPLEAGGVLLTGLTTPDLRGTQGTYQFFTTDIYSEPLDETEFGGNVSPIEFDSAGRARARIIGPWNPITRQKRNRLLTRRAELERSGGARAELVALDAGLAALEAHNYLSVPVTFTLTPGGTKLGVELPGRNVTLAQGQWSDWLELEFSLNFLVRVRGITRFLPVALGDEVRVYMSPIEIHPEHPVLPISYPADFAARLARNTGLFKTRGWAAETSALKEHRIGEAAFIQDLDRMIDQREAMCIEVLDNDKPNLFVEVFSCADRVQHMFWRFEDKGHPLYDPKLDKRFGDAILNVYKRMDRFVGLVRERYEDDDTLLMVCSDHGFASFRKGVNINTWLVDNGYMRLKGQDNPRYNLRDLFGGGDFFANVDWRGTRAYALGLGLIFINLAGREGRGIVQPGEEYDNLVTEIGNKLLELCDPDDGSRVVSAVYPGREVYRGGRTGEAPDIVVGFSRNYRVSWQTALGGVPAGVLEPNMEKWSGDHCSVDRELVPGVLLTNRAFSLPRPDLRDLAPTALRFLGCPVPDQYEGRDLFGAGV